MDANLYFHLTDRIREAMTPDALTVLGSEIERLDAHEFERRALRTLVSRRRELLAAHHIVLST